MYATLAEFKKSWNHEAASTQKLLDLLTDKSLEQEVTPEGRTLGRIAWHIVTTIHEMMTRTGLTFEAAGHDSAPPAVADALADGYRQASEAFIEAIDRQWNDESLQEKHNLYGEAWTNALTLDILIRHQAHHRGQMTVLMRQAGLVVTGVYGPAKEEWSAFGMEAPVV